MTIVGNDVEEVVLVDDDGFAIGRVPKSSVHGQDTPLHLAFSCHVLNEKGEVLVTRRSLSKGAWPGVWTNSFCGHPGPSEPLLAAVRRRATFELGLALAEIELVLPLFRYRATDASGVVENEICPVYVANSAGEPRPHPREVMETVWADPRELGESIRRTPWAFSPWLVLQAARLPFFGGDPVAGLALDQAAGAGRQP